jgi:hypothetical protein
VPPQFLESLSHLLQEVPCGGLRHLPVTPQVVPQVSTSTELQHKVQAVGILHRHTAAGHDRLAAAAAHKYNLLYNTSITFIGLHASLLLACCCVRLISLLEHRPVASNIYSGCAA